MLNPSYSTLIKIINEENALDNQITSRYSIVIAAAKRARQIVSGAHCDSAGVHSDKAVSIAVSEMERGQLRIVPVEPEAAPAPVPVIPGLLDEAYGVSLRLASQIDPDFEDDEDDDDFDGTADEVGYDDSDYEEYHDDADEESDEEPFDKEDDYE